MRPQTIRFAVLLLAGAVPFIGLLIWAERAQTRSPADLGIADRCVDWAHEPRDARALDGPEVAAQCDRYFRVRSDKDGDEDDGRWEARTSGKAQPGMAR